MNFFSVHTGVVYMVKTGFRLQQFMLCIIRHRVRLRGRPVVVMLSDDSTSLLWPGWLENARGGACGFFVLI